MYHKLYHLTFDYVVIVFTVSSVKPHPVDNCQNEEIMISIEHICFSDFRERPIKIKGTE